MTESSLQAERQKPNILWDFSTLWLYKESFFLMLNSHISASRISVSLFSLFFSFPALSLNMVSRVRSLWQRPHVGLTFPVFLFRSCHSAKQVLIFQTPHVCYWVFMFSDKPGAAYSVPLSPPSSYAQLALTHSGLVTLTLSNFLDGWCST